MSQKTPYIGSTISLISKLNIRYEGILFTVNSAESTIALAQVRSFGTENRPTSRPVPVRNDVYEYIIFKASDIKDLVVCDTPKDNNSETQIISQPTEKSFENNSVNSVQQAEKNVNCLSNDTKTNLRQFRTNNLSRNYNNNYNTMFYQRNNNNSGIPSYRNNQKSRLKFDSDYDFEKANEQFQHTLNSLGLDIEKINFKNNTNNKSDVLIEQKNNKVEKESKKENDLKTKTVNGVEKEKKENGNGKKKIDKFYDKKSSFFDCISCETQEKEEGKNIRLNWKKERLTNQETFGHSAVRSLAFKRNRNTQISGFKFNNISIKNRQFIYRSAPISNYQINNGYTNYNNHHVNNNNNQQNNRRYTTQRFTRNTDLEVDAYKRRTVGTRLRAF